MLIQGLALDHHGWDSAIADFRGRSTIVFDHRGTGASADRFTGDWSARDFARDVISILDAAGIDRAHVYGHSMGGRIAQWLGAEHAERIVSLVLGATTIGDSTGVARPEHATKSLASGDPAELAALFYPPAWLREHPEEAGSVLPAAASPAAMRAHLGAVARHDGPDPRHIAPGTFVRLRRRSTPEPRLPTRRSNPRSTRRSTVQCGVPSPISTQMSRRTCTTSPRRFPRSWARWTNRISAPGGCASPTPSRTHPSSSTKPIAGC
ncbi:alpha/beta fold hydrolase [Nocardia sp. NPDC051750]|uniref:alpha/beta fold hydrolase n=1 Tax=Nocardia sp. NPDC051750 TaxID=3364325 RepID=UPI0037A375D5